MRSLKLGIFNYFWIGGGGGGGGGKDELASGTSERADFRTTTWRREKKSDSTLTTPAANAENEINNNNIVDHVLKTYRYTEKNIQLNNEPRLIVEMPVNCHATSTLNFTEVPFDSISYVTKW